MAGCYSLLAKRIADTELTVSKHRREQILLENDRRMVVCYTEISACTSLFIVYLCSLCVC